MPKPCSVCGAPADFSVVLLVSTLRVRPRQQNSPSSISLCSRCLGVRGPGIAPEVAAGLASALTIGCNALTKDSNGQSHSPESPVAMPGESDLALTANTGSATASCRSCLIACNSRHYDEVPAPGPSLKDRRNGD
jgi:hypothetical protein